MNITSKNGMVIAGIYDRAADKPVYLGLYDNESVARREVFRLVHRAEYKDCAFADDFLYIVVTGVEIVGDTAVDTVVSHYKATPLKDIASSYGVSYKSMDSENG